MFRIIKERKKKKKEWYEIILGKYRKKVSVLKKEKKGMIFKSYKRSIEKWFNYI